MDASRLDFNLLSVLDALLAEQSVTRAAARLNLSPSATSGSLSRLRDFFGDELLTRAGRRLVRTPLGDSLQPAIRDCLLHVQATLEIRPKFAPATACRNFRLMMSDYASTVLMPQVGRRLERDAPGVTLELLAMSEEPWEALDRGDLDFLILPECFVRDAHPSAVLFADEYVCVLAAGHPDIGMEISLEQFCSLGHVITRVGNQRPPTVDARFFERLGHERRIELIAPSFASVPHLLVGTRRIAVMHRRLADIYCRMLPLKIVPSPLPMPAIVERVQWHRHRETDPGRVWLEALLHAAVAGDAAPATPSDAVYG
jgi:LysR family transcriptional regulator, nod-box dependent transcriptional activator